MMSVQDTIKKCSPWMRLSLCINIHVKKSLINVLHNHINDSQVQRLPSDPADLYAFLQTKKRIIQKSTVIKAHQKSILLPASGQTVDSSSFDISLSRFLIQTFCGIRNAKRDWKEPDPTDQTICAYVYRAAAMRNSICHDSNIEILKATEFERKWKQLKEILQGLKYVEDIEPFKTETLDFEKYENVILEEFVDHLKSYKEECSNESFQDDYIPRRFYVDGTAHDIVTETDLEILVKENDCLIIHGEAGMGKSLVARKVKNEWCNRKVFDSQNIIYYDSKRMNKEIRIQSNAAALVFSQLGDHLKKKGRTVDDLSIYNCVKTIINDLIIVVDGVDEFPVKELVTGDYVDKLEKKIINNEEITGTETIIAIYFGHLFPYSKVILLGRIGEIENLKKIKSKGNKAIFNRKTKSLKLLKFDDTDIKVLTCLKICKQPSQQSICTGTCQAIYAKIKDIELCKNPTDLNSLLELHKKHPNGNIGRITRTKLTMATILNRLNEHIYQKNWFAFQTFYAISKQKDLSKYLECIRSLGEISFTSLLTRRYVTIKVNEKQDSNGIVYFENENQVRIERKIFEELDLFYVRDLEYYFILEPYHTLNIEALCAFYLFSHPDEWDSIFELNVDRHLIIISFIAGLYADDYFTKDFVENVLDTSSYSLEQFFNWLYNAEDVRENLPNDDRGYYHWYGLMENKKLSPSLFLLDFISHEVEIPQTFIPKTIVCYCAADDYRNEWYDMDYFKHNFLTKLADKLNIELFSKKFPSFKFIIKSDLVEIKNIDEFNRLNRCVENNLITFKIDTLHIWTSLDTCFSSNLSVNLLDIRDYCDSRTLDMIFNALSTSSTKTYSSNIQPLLKCKQLEIDYISHFNSQQTEKLVELGLCAFDYIKLGSYAFLTDDQLAILKSVECKNNKLINIELNDVEFIEMLGLPSLGNRHLSFFGVDNLTENELIEIRKQILPGYSNNLINYKIIDPFVPFVKKENYMRDAAQSMCLHFIDVNFTKVSPEVFANTFSLIPSLSFLDNSKDIPSSHWLRLSQTDACRINEMRIWYPSKKNFEHFLNIETRVSQFLSRTNRKLKKLLNYIVNNQSIPFDRQIKVFVVNYDKYDWNCYEEITLFSRKTIQEYKDNCSQDNLLLDKIRVPFHEDIQRFKWWCCEISLPFQEKIEFSVTNTYNHSEETKEENSVEEIDNELSAIQIIGDVVYFKVVKKEHLMDNYDRTSENKI